MGRGDDDPQFKAAKKGYREASAEGNREEEARFANLIGDMLKKRGEYVEALKWLQIDYNVSIKFLPQKQLLPTCQSIGEVHFLLGHFKQALIYQKKHLDLAKESGDLVEQQRANTQLGRTYHEIFLTSEDDHLAKRNAKKYYKLAMNLARVLKEKNTNVKSLPFIKEFIDAQNNIGLLELDLDNLEEAERILLEGLKICDEEEVIQNDEGRTRLHHNLGRVYLELRDWTKSREHIEKDIVICKRIGHLQGEAKGFINLGEMYYRNQKYDEAINCYQKALNAARSMEDEYVLVYQITQNIKTVKEAVHVQEEIKDEEQKLKKLARTTCNAKGTSHERGYLLEQNAALDRLIEKTSMIFSWKRHLEFAKRKKRVVCELRDKEKMGDSYLAIAESYHNLRYFNKARKWYMKSWITYRSIGNLEGQALAKIRIGELLDSCGDWAGALEAFEEGYRIAVQAKLLSIQLSALNNMHYSHMMRFDNVEDARKLQCEMQNLKSLLSEEDELRNIGKEYCSETETEGLDMPADVSSESIATDTWKAHNIIRSKKINHIKLLDDNDPLASVFRSCENSPKQKESHAYSPCGRTVIPCRSVEDAKYCFNNSSCQLTVGRKRSRIVISDDELDECHSLEKARERIQGIEDTATSKEDYLMNGGIPTLDNISKDAACSDAPRDVLSTCMPVDLEGSSSSKLQVRKASAKKSLEFESINDTGDVETSKSIGNESRMNSHQVSHSMQKMLNEHITCKVGCDLVYVDAHSCFDGAKLNTENLKVEIAHLYYLQFIKEKASKGMLPVIKKLKINGEDRSLSEAAIDLDIYLLKSASVDVVIDEWAPKRMMKLYLDYCEKMSEGPNFELLKKLYNLEVSEDEIVVSDCGLQDVSITPFIDALCEHKTMALLDVSHNFLGNETMERFKQMFTSSAQTYGTLILDFHCNRFGPTSLFQICECPVLFARLEVLNLSENRLTDACSSYLSTILTNCKALYSLSIESCCITSRTIQRIADVLHDGHGLSQLNIGKNSPISGNSMISLLSKLTRLNSFSELGLTGIKLHMSTINSLCQLSKSASISNLMLGSTSIGGDGAVQVLKALSDGPQELAKLDISYCAVGRHMSQVCTDIGHVEGLLELNLEGNSFEKSSCRALSSMLVNSRCSLKVLVLSNCQLGFYGLLQIFRAVKGNGCLEELIVSNNIYGTQEEESLFDKSTDDVSRSWDEPKKCTLLNQEMCNMEVPDSDDEVSKTDVSRSSCSCWTPFTRSSVLEELSEGIVKAKRLVLLDLSYNGLSEETIGTLYTAWSSRPGISARKHVQEKVAHFSVEGKKCCGVRTCCRRRDGSPV